jgi:hypothetical protein
MNFGGLLAGLGSGAIGGYFSALNDQERADLERRKEDAARELRQMTLDARAAGSGGGGKADGILGSYLNKTGANVADAVGFEVNPVDKGRFTSQQPFARQESLATEGTDSAIGLIGDNNDAVSRKALEGKFQTKETFDEQGYTAAERARRENNRKVMTEVDNPSATKALHEGRAQEQVNRLGELAMSTSDVKTRDALIQEANKLSVALNGKDRYKLEGGQVVDVASGDVKDTELSKAKTGKENAQAARAGRESTSSDKTDAAEDRTVAAASKLVESKSKLLSDAEKRAKDNVPALSKAEAYDTKKVESHAARVAEAIANDAEVKAAREALTAARQRESTLLDKIANKKTDPMVKKSSDNLGTATGKKLDLNQFYRK